MFKRNLVAALILMLSGIIVSGNYFLTGYNKPAMMPKNTLQGVVVKTKIYIDKDFSFQQKTAIINSLFMWSAASNGLLQWELSDSVIGRYEQLLDIKSTQCNKEIKIVPITSNDETVKKIDEEINKNSLDPRDRTYIVGYYQYSCNLKFIYVVIDRIDSTEEFAGVVAHEIGHYLGLNHIQPPFNAKTLMGAVENNKTAKCPTYHDMEQFCKLYSCNVADMHYCMR